MCVPCSAQTGSTDMKRFLLLMCSLSLILAGSFYLHQQNFADGAHQHSQPSPLTQLTTVDESDEHSHFSSMQDQQDLNAGTLHCGSKILGLIQWDDHRCIATDQIIPIRQFYSRYGIWAMLDPPPPRSVSRSTSTTA